MIDPIRKPVQQTMFIDANHEEYIVIQDRSYNLFILDTNYVVGQEA